MDARRERIALLPKDGTTREKPSKVHQALTLLACMYLHFMSFGLTFSLGIIYVELVRYFDTQHSLAALVQSVYQGLTFMGGIVVSHVVAKYDVGAPAILASIFGSTSLFVSTFSVNIYMVIVFVGIIGGLCMSVNYLCAFVAVSETFDRNRKSAIASLTIASALGQTLLPILIGYLVTMYGWTGALMIASGLMLNSVACGLFLYFSRKRSHVNKQHQQQGVANNNYSTRLCACSTRKNVAYLVFIVVCLCYATGNVENWFIVDLCDRRGYGRDAGTVLLSLLGVCGLIGRILGATLLKLRPNISMEFPFSGALLGFGIAHYLVIYLTDYDGMLAGCVLRGICAGLIMSIQPGIILELVGIHKFPKAVALSNFLNGMVQIASGFLGGLVVDLTGGYGLAFYFASGTAIASGLAMVIIWWLRTQHSSTSSESCYTWLFCC